MANTEIPKPSLFERGAGAVALVSGVSLLVTVGIPFVINLLDAETLEIPTLIAALPVELPELGAFLSSVEVWHGMKTRREGLSTKEHADHPVTRVINDKLRPLHAAHNSRRTALKA